MSTCGERSLYTSLCSRSGRKFNIFWSTKSDWYKRMLCHVQQYNLTQPLAFSPHSRARTLPVWHRCLRQGTPVNLQLDLGQNTTLRWFYPGVAIFLQKGWMGPRRYPSVQPDASWRRNPGTTGIRHDEKYCIKMKIWNISLWKHKIKVGELLLISSICLLRWTSGKISLTCKCFSADKPTHPD